MMEFAATPIIIVKFRTEKEMRVSFRDNKFYNRMCPSVCLFIHLCVHAAEWLD